MELENFIAQNTDKIVKEWIDFAKDKISLTDTMSHIEVKDHITQILDRIVFDMGMSQTSEEQKIKSQGNKELNPEDIVAARDHGEQRLDFGFDFMQLSSEFRALRASVLRLWTEKSYQENWKIDFHDLIRFNEAVDEVWMISLKHFQEKLDESKNLFLSILGHDLRNPIATIKGAHSILKLSNNLSEKEKRTIEYSDQSVKRMVELIDNLLELTELRLGSGMSIEKEELNFSNLLEKIVHQQQIAYPKIQIKSYIKTNIIGNYDRIRLSQMVTNLINNAVKHGEENGLIEVKLSSDKKNAILSIHNDGPDIPDDILDKIFDGRFTSSNGGTSKNKNYGLGLLIVREIVEGHQGEIEVSSSAENGTTFKIILPIK